jgi:FKBP-type peptidyl-prolyl cis-trans isomerase FklB
LIELRSFCWKEEENVRRNANRLPKGLSICGADGEKMMSVTNRRDSLLEVILQSQKLTMFRRILFFIAASLLLLTVFAGTNQEGLDFLASKAQEEGVVKRDSGLMYTVLRDGTGKSPSVNSPTRCHYEGRKIDGTVFDSSYKRGRPATFAPNQVIKGWTEVRNVPQRLAGAQYYVGLP